MGSSKDVSRVNIVFPNWPRTWEEDPRDIHDRAFEFIKKCDLESDKEEILMEVRFKENEQELIRLISYAQFHTPHFYEEESTTWGMIARPVFTSVNMYVDEWDGRFWVKLKFHEKFPRQKDFKKILWDTIIPKILREE